MSNLIKVHDVVRTHIREDFWAIADGKIGRANNLVYGPDAIDGHTTLIKFGETFEFIMMDLAQLRYPGRLFPRVLAGYGVQEDEVDLYLCMKNEDGKPTERKNAVTILTRLDEVEIVKSIAEITATFRRDKKRNARRNAVDRFTQDKFAEISQRLLEEIPLQEEIWEVNVDMCFFANDIWNVCELKLSGDMDAGKNLSTLERNLMLPYIALGERDKQVFFGVCSANTPPQATTGEWAGGLGAYLTPDVVLVDKVLFDLIAPEDVTYDEIWDMITDRAEAFKPTELLVS